jgi:hypothetical protein
MKNIYFFENLKYKNKLEILILSFCNYIHNIILINTIKNKNNTKLKDKNIIKYIKYLHLLC